MEKTINHNNDFNEFCVTHKVDEKEYKDEIIALFPFAIDATVQLKRGLGFIKKTDGWGNDPIINEQTRFYNSVIDPLRTKIDDLKFKNNNKLKIKNRCKEKMSGNTSAIFLKKDFKEKDIENIRKEFEKVNQENERKIYWTFRDDIFVCYKDGLQIKPMQYKLCYFDNAIGIAGVSFEIIYYPINMKENEFYDLFHNLKLTMRTIGIKNLIDGIIKETLEENTNVKYFEKKKTKEKKESQSVEGKYEDALKPVFFSTISLKYNSAKHNGYSLIPYWYSGLVKTKNNALRHEDIIDRLSAKKYDLSLNSVVIGCVDGCCLFNCVPDPHINKDAAQYINKNAYKFKQHTFITYILILHQYFFIQWLREKNSKISFGEENTQNKREVLSEEATERLAELANKYIIGEVSAENNFQLLYEYLKEQTGINRNYQDIKEHILPINKAIQKKQEDKNNELLLILGITNILTLIYTLFSEKMPCGIKIALFCVAILTLVIVIIRGINWEKLNKKVNKKVEKIKDFIKKKIDLIKKR